jgi:hypothetical protein
MFHFREAGKTATITTHDSKRTHSGVHSYCHIATKKQMKRDNDPPNSAVCGTGLGSGGDFQVSSRKWGPFNSISAIPQAAESNNRVS